MHVAQTAPAVSVILPTFNRLRYLREAVASALAQTVADWELIIADDGSDGPTLAFLESLTDPRVRRVHLAHTGRPSIVRNAAIREARGEYLAFLDSDDIWLPSKLQVQLAAMRARPDRRWSYGAVRRIGPDSAVLRGDEARRWVSHEGAIFEQLLRLEVGVATPTVVAERRLVEQAGAFDEGQPFFEEYDLWLRMSLLSEAAVIREPLVLVRCHHEEHYSSDRVGVYEARLRLLDKHAANASSPRLRSALREGRAMTGIWLAAAHAALGQRRSALDSLWRERARLVRTPHLWGRAAAAAARALAPRILRRRRASPRGNSDRSPIVGRGRVRE